MEAQFRAESTNERAKSLAGFREVWNVAQTQIDVRFGLSGTDGDPIVTVDNG